MPESDEYQVGVTPATRGEIRRLFGYDPVDDLGLQEMPAPSADDVVIVRRAPGPHTASARIERCSRCQHLVWVARTTAPEPQRVCLQCFEKMNRTRSSAFCRQGMHWACHGWAGASAGDGRYACPCTCHRS